MSRPDIYYWKCDRPCAFHGTETRGQSPTADQDIAGQLCGELRRALATDAVQLVPATSQGIHRTWTARVAERELFVRVDDSADGGCRLEMESAIMGVVRHVGLPVPQVHACDASRQRVPFAWQAIDRLPYPDLNHWFKAGTLDCAAIPWTLGRDVARWQAVRSQERELSDERTPLPAPKLTGFGPFDWEAWQRGEGLRGFHRSYADYFYVRLDVHLDFLVGEQFLTPEQRHQIASEIAAHRDCLQIEQGCLVHKDLALWNVLGQPDRVVAYIDFDDAIAGDPLDDLSLLACFHDAAWMEQAFAGYQSVLPFPAQHRRRFWLHLLRNMIVKAVIRLGAGYFRRDSAFFLIASGGSGEQLRQFTLDRIAIALAGLREDAELSLLEEKG